jgi:hypothetical protein
LPAIVAEITNADIDASHAREMFILGLRKFHAFGNMAQLT